MDLTSALLLSLSVVLTVGRNLFSKEISSFAFGDRGFFMCQTAIFSSGSILLLLTNLGKPFSLSLLTLAYAVLYSLLLLSAQWCYTVALRGGQIAICATVYSLGFIFPTFSGMLFWGEPVSALKILGILVVIPTIILSANTKAADTKKNTGRLFIIFLLIAMVSSGALGIVQKLQQKSPFADEREAFVLVSFILSAVISLICALSSKRGYEKINAKKTTFSLGCGVCFAACNLLNTTLAGRLESAIFFPTLNIGVIILSLLFGITLFKERFTRNHLWVLLLGILSILLISL